jgi:hypothetical protein
MSLIGEFFRRKKSSFFQLKLFDARITTVSIPSFRGCLAAGCSSAANASRDFIGAPMYPHITNSPGRAEMDLRDGDAR